MSSDEDWVEAKTMNKKQRKVGAPIAGEGSYSWMIGRRICFAILWGMVAATLALAIVLVVREDFVQYHTSSSCSDGNQCTIDYQFEGGCQSFPLANGAACTNVCNTNGTDDTCLYGVCQSSTCAGSCLTGSITTCPAISQSATVQCVNNVCLYNTYVTPPAQLPVTVISGPLLDQLCLYSVNNTAYLNCLSVTSARNATLITCDLQFACATMFNVL